MSEGIRIKNLKHKTTEGRLEELSKIRTKICSDEAKIREYLYFIAEELTLLNINNRRK